MGEHRDALIADLRGLVGRRHVLTGNRKTASFTNGYRFGEGPVLAAVRPASLVELWRVARTCVCADVSLIIQAANTGLTGGSTPDGDDYPGGMVLVNTMRIAGIHLIDNGRQVICLPGATLCALERALEPLGREPHSVIGSSCMGASVLGGICNNSGGALTRRGPAFTELALYGRVTHLGELELVNHLGIELGTEPEEMLRRLELGMFNPADIDHDSHRTASCQDYGSHVRDVSSPIPARFNADPRCLSEASGSAGKLVLFAARLDTFPLEKETTTFYVGSNDPAELGALRRSILTDLEQLPIAGEYLHRDMFDIAERYGKDTFLAIQHLGAGRLPMLFKLRRSIDNLAEALGLGWLKFSDRLMQALGSLFPRHLPGRLYEYRDRFEHHLLLKVSSADASPAHALLEKFYPSATGDFFECTHEEQCKAFTHRFAAAGAAVRYRAVHRDRVEEIVALDIALPRNCSDWFERLPPEIDEAISHKLYYGHFLCHVFHQDYLVKKGRNPVALEHKMWAFLDERGAEYPAEHNVGHLYKAKPALVAFYRSIDPRNQLNPGIGQTTKRRFWGEAPHSTVLSYSSRAAPPA